MTYGKRTCKILKEIRQQIAEKNDIEYVTSECHFRGECEGTCPKCEEELQYLENELNKRRQLGKAVAVAGIALGIVGTSLDCNAQQQTSMPIVNKMVEDTVVITPIYTQTDGTGTIVKGKVLDDKSEPLEFATVRLMQGEKLIIGMHTDKNGLFTFDGSIPTGMYDIIITYLGLTKYIMKNLEIKENSATDIGEVQLKNDPNFKIIVVGRPRYFQVEKTNRKTKKNKQISK